MSESIYEAALRMIENKRVVESEKLVCKQFKNDLARVKGLPVEAQIDALLDHTKD